MMTPAPSADDSGLLFQALNVANRAHAGQYRKVSQVPYLIHPLNVSKILADLDFSEVPLRASALLHDVVEDGNVTIPGIREEFGEEIAALVDAVSYPDKKISWWDRRRQTVDDLKTAPENVLILSCADKFDNLTSIHQDLQRLGPAMWSYFRSPPEMQAWYYRSLSEVFQARRREGTPAAALFDAFRAQVGRTFDASTTEGGGLF